MADPATTPLVDRLRAQITMAIANRDDASATLLEEAANALAADDLEDMADCGRSLMAAISAVMSDPSPLSDWAPAQDPAEIVTDLFEMLQEERDKLQDAIRWAVGRWAEEVSARPLVNVHRRTLDDTWRQVIRHFGGDPDALVGPCHDALLAGGNADTGGHQICKRRTP